MAQLTLDGESITVSINSTSEEVRSFFKLSGSIDTLKVSINSTSEEVRSRNRSTNCCWQRFPLIQLPRKSEDQKASQLIYWHDQGFH